jgi:predicted RNA binding protein YcfA (HicA-like mRNA interferase family)
VPTFGPVKRKDLIRCLREVGFSGPFSSGKHPFMAMGDITIRVPNPHQVDIGKELLSRILRQAGIGKDDWEKL